MQRALIQYRDSKNYDLVFEALKRTNRMDLVGFGKDCLIRPRKDSTERKSGGEGNRYSERRQEKKETKEGRNGKKKRTIRNVHKKKIR